MGLVNVIGVTLFGEASSTTEQLLIPSIEVSGPDPHGIVLCGWTQLLSPQSLSHKAEPTIPRPKVLLRFPSATAFDKSIEHAGRVFKLGTIQTLLLEQSGEPNSPSFDSNTLRNICWLMRWLHSLIVHVLDAETLASFLDPGIIDPQLFTSSFVPNLQELTGREVRWKSPLDIKLSGVLACRAQISMPIEKLVLRECEVKRGENDIIELLHFIKVMDLDDTYELPSWLVRGTIDPENDSGELVAGYNLNADFEFGFDEEGCMV